MYGQRHGKLALTMKYLQYIMDFMVKWLKFENQLEKIDSVVQCDLLLTVLSNSLNWVEIFFYSIPEHLKDYCNSFSKIKSNDCGKLITASRA
jgi:hypothetical protein